MIWLHRFSKLLALTTFLLILAGGWVTSTGSGLSVPDWPLSYGQFFPPMIGGIRFEHTHRLIAALVALCTLIQMLWLFRAEQRQWIRWLAAVSFAAVLAQALLGGLTVIYLLPTAISVLHACIAQTFLSLIVAIALFTSVGWKDAAPIESEKAGSFQRLVLVSTILLYVQLILGALVRHTKGMWVGPHILAAFLVLFHVLRAAFRASHEFPSEGKIVKPAVFLGLAVILQFFLGLGVFAMEMMLRDAFGGHSAGAVLFATAHQSLGAVILATGVFLTLRSFRFIKAKD